MVKTKIKTPSRKRKMTDNAKDFLPTMVPPMNSSMTVMPTTTALTENDLETLADNQDFLNLIMDAIKTTKETKSARDIEIDETIKCIMDPNTSSTIVVEETVEGKKPLKPNGQRQSEYVPLFTDLEKNDNDDFARVKIYRKKRRFLALARNSTLLTNYIFITSF